MSLVSDLSEQDQQCRSNDGLGRTELCSLDSGKEVIIHPSFHCCVNEEAEIAEEAGEERGELPSGPAGGRGTASACCCSCHSSSGLDNSLCNGTDTYTDIAFQNKTLAPLFIECGRPVAAASNSVCDHAVASALSPAKSTTSERICRICLDAVDSEQLIAPCKCSGSTKYAHETCLLQWFFRSKKKSCELCLGKVNVKPVGFKPVQEWRLPEKKCDFIVYLFGLYFLIMLIFTGMITWIATQGCTSPVCVTLYAVCGVALIYFIYCCGCVEYSRSYWKALVSVNRVWRIYGREENRKDIETGGAPDPASRSSASFPGSLALRFQTPTGILSYGDYPSDPCVFRSNDLKQCLGSADSRSAEGNCDMDVAGTDNLAVEYDDLDHEIAMHLSESTPRHFVLPYSTRSLQDSESEHYSPTSKQLRTVEIIDGSMPCYYSSRDPDSPTDFEVISTTEVFPAIDDITYERQMSLNIDDVRFTDSCNPLERTQFSTEGCQQRFALTKL